MIESENEMFLKCLNDFNDDYHPQVFRQQDFSKMFFEYHPDILFKYSSKLPRELSISNLSTIKEIKS
jgi:hypothetical protein